MCLPVKVRQCYRQGVLGSQDYMEGKRGSEPMPANESQDSADMLLRMTFRSHVEKTFDALSFKATWFLKVNFTGISTLS